MKVTIFGLLALAVSTYAQNWEYTPNAVPLNGQVALSCVGSGTLEIYHKGTKVETGNDFTLTASVGKLEVTIKKVTEHFSGEYICRGTTGPESKVFVKIAVSFPNDKQTFSKTIGSKATVGFYVVGIPRPAITYFRTASGGGVGAKLVEISTAGVVTKATGGERFSIDSEKGYLVIDKVENGDGGGYTAQVKSVGVLHTGTLTLIVGEKPNIVTPPAKEYKVTNGESATLTCTFKSTPSTLRWVWKKSSGGTSNIDSTTTGNIVLDGTNLKIVKADATIEKDKFECYGENTFGNATAETVISVVYVTPKISGVSNQDVVVDNNKTLTCTASGNPKPTVSWSKQGADGKFVALAGQKQTPGSSEFCIVKAQEKDAGSYQCEAILADKPSLKDVELITVTVQTPPKIITAETTTKQRYPVGMNEAKDLTCAATGSPLPTITFQKAGIFLSGATVVSQDAKKIVMKLSHAANATSDAGNVFCTAKSSIGSDNVKIMIEMIEKPAAPTGLKETAVENDYVILEWSPVSGAKNYVVFVDGVAKAPSPITKNVKIDNLESAKSYSFAVAASNEAGTGEKSVAVKVQTLKYGLPSQPRPDPKGPPTSFTNTKATFMWQAPAESGGDPNLSYVIEYCPESQFKTYGNCKNVTSNTTQVTIEGLKENTKYRFTISVKNARGIASASAFYASTGSEEGGKPTDKPKTSKPEPGSKSGLSGGAIAGIIVAVILILLIVIDLFCCFFNECGFTYCCYQACCAGKGKGKYAAAEANDAEKGEELKETGNNHDAEVKTAPEEKEEKEPAKEKKTEDV